MITEKAYNSDEEVVGRAEAQGNHSGCPGSNEWMDRESILERMAEYGPKELEAWKRHVLRCRAHFARDQNLFEVEECDFLLRSIEERLRDTEVKK